MKSLRFKVKYTKGQQTKKRNEARYIVYARNMESTKAILKVP